MPRQNVGRQRRAKDERGGEKITIKFPLLNEPKLAEAELER